MSAQAAAAATNAAASAAKTAAAATQPATAKATGFFSKYCVAPVMNTLHKVERRSATKVSAVEPATTHWIQQHEATGADAASTATKNYLHLQGQLMHYRVVRLFDETRYILSGQYCRNYSLAKAIDDARYLTQLCVIFLIAVMVGRRGVFSPIAPDSPFAIALDHKVNPNY